MTISAASNNYYSAMNYGAPPSTMNATTPPIVGGQPSGMGSGDFTTISSMVATGAGGGFATFKMFGPKGPKMHGIKGMLGAGFKGAGISALVSAGVSAVGNGIGVATGKIDSSTAVGNVLTDTLSGAAGGLGAMAVGGIGHALLGKLGMGGIPLTIATVALGALAGTAAGQHTRAFISGKFQ